MSKEIDYEMEYEAFDIRELDDFDEANEDDLPGYWASSDSED